MAKWQNDFQCAQNVIVTANKKIKIIRFVRHQP